ncbi:hypothetical protein BEWA_002610 [Theileria equi strain WA]|uniref:Signal peptide-containing protein n=1 Tax=Theileria equi strain WA TaxID=1537102 RepID=L0B149_THEEQ|nr:hypothetical protein BEWA_002610 [Theileria equi strain WA]AFZ80854.1 hypothetical protein BEWA_002610 [Theileria equi strain WA]|eukprot:XP_004830520.1 hypothetical protein BEWA_002610 [Theileria equi strain WA]
MKILSFCILLFGFYTSLCVFPGSIANSGREEKDESFEVNITQNMNTDKYRVVTTHLNDVKVTFFVPNPGYIPVSIVQDNVRIWHANQDENCAYCMVYFQDEKPLMVYFLRETRFGIDHVYYKFKNGGWEQSKKRFDSKIGKLKVGTEESGDLLTLDLRMPVFGTNKVIGCTLFGLYTRFIITSGGRTNTVSFGGVHIWTARPGEKCIFVVHHSRNEEEPAIFDIFYTTSSGSFKHSYHVRKDTTWTEVNMEGYYREIKALKGIQDNIDSATARGEPTPVRCPFTLNLDNPLIAQVSVHQARRNDVKCTNYEVRERNSATKVICQGQVLWEAATVYEKCASVQVMSVASHAIAKLKVRSRFCKNRYFEMIAGTYTEIQESEFKPLVDYMKKCSERRTSVFTGPEDYVTDYSIDAAFQELEDYEKSEDGGDATGEEETEDKTDDERDDSSSAVSKSEEDITKIAEPVSKSDDSLEKADAEVPRLEELVVRPKIRPIVRRKSRGKIDTPEMLRSEKFRTASYDVCEVPKPKEIKSKEGKFIVPLEDLNKDFVSSVAKIVQSLEYAQSTTRAAQATLEGYSQSYRETKESIGQDKVDEARKTIEAMQLSLKGDGATSATSSALERALECLPSTVEFKENVVYTQESVLKEVLGLIHEIIYKLQSMQPLPKLDDEPGLEGTSKESDEEKKE